MNKLKIKENSIYLSKEDGNLKIDISSKEKFLDVKSIKIKVIKDTDLVIESTDENKKIDICINILENIHLNIYELKRTENCKFQYKYYLEKNSLLKIEKVCDCTGTTDMVLINLNGEKAEVNYNLKTISKNQEKYIFMVYHNANKTKSNINNNGVNIKEGQLEFNVSSFVPNNIKKCDVSQSGRIINNTERTCMIKPNLFIDEEDVIANHSALIGTFSYDELFYLMSRGINEEKAKLLLTKGFLLKGISYHKEKLIKILDRYWR